MTLGYVEKRNEWLWLRCSPCGNEKFVEAETFAGETGLDLRTPLLAISWRLRCTRCGERKAHANPEPYGTQYWQRKATRAADADQH